MKANAHTDILKTMQAAGLGFECVSIGEVQAVRALGVVGERILYTPNFAPRAEIAQVLAMNDVRVTVDSLWALEKWGEMFLSKDIFVRVDPGAGRGHHDHVKTGGQQSKFGIAVADLEKLAGLVDKAGARVVGLHAQAGSGILEPDSWQEVALVLAQAAELFPHVTVLDVGGGLGVPEKPGQSPLDLEALDAMLAKVKAKVLSMLPSRASEVKRSLSPNQVKHLGQAVFELQLSGLMYLDQDQIWQNIPWDGGPFFHHPPWPSPEADTV